MSASKCYKVTAQWEERSDGGLHAWSDEVPGLVLSHKDPQNVLGDVEPALRVILSAMLQSEVEITRLRPLPTVAPADHAHQLDFAVTVAA